MSEKARSVAAERRSGSIELAVLPNGEALRPQAVERISIEPWATLLGQEGARYAVVVHLVGGLRRVVGSDLARDEAAELGRRCGAVINEAMRGG